MPDTLNRFYRNFGLSPLPDVIDQMIRESVVTPSRFFNRFFDGVAPYNVIETDNEIYLQMALPGVRPEIIDLHLVGRELTVVAKFGVPKIEGKVLVQGLPFEDEVRETFTLPFEV